MLTDLYWHERRNIIISINEKLKEKILESLFSVLPITCIVLLISMILVPMEIGTLALFLMGALLLTVGMGFFQLGAETTMTILGQGIGGWMIKRKNIYLIIIVSFLVGAIITVSEPDLQVLAAQVASIPNMVLIWTVALGVGIFLVIAVLRILFKVSLKKIITIFYIALFLLSFFSPDAFTAVAFDSGGVTTGPMTVPFIMAIGVGLSASRSDAESVSDSFGLIAFCSIGPILMVLLLGMIYHPSEATYNAVEIVPVITSQDVMFQFLQALPQYIHEVMISILPIIVVFILFQIIAKKYSKRQVIRMSIGFIYTIIGLILFLTGVNVGFAPVGNLLGSSLASTNYSWILIPIGMVIGYYIVKAEPAVQVLNNQVEEITGGSISANSMNLCLSIGVAFAVGLAMVRVLTGINIYYILIPGYIIALILSHFVENVFVGISFDSGGVASGAMTTTFLLPMAMGACLAAGGDVVKDAFGIVAMVAMTPLIAIQIMGFIYTRKAKQLEALPVEEVSDDIILLEDEENENDI